MNSGLLSILTASHFQSFYKTNAGSSDKFRQIDRLQVLWYIRVNLCFETNLYIQPMVSPDTLDYIKPKTGRTSSCFLFSVNIITFCIGIVF